MERDKKLKILYKKERTGFILKNLTHLYSLFSESGKVTMKKATDKNVLYESLPHFSQEIKRYFSQYSLSFSTLIVYPLLNGDLIKKFIHYYHLRVK